MGGLRSGSANGGGKRSKLQRRLEAALSDCRMKQNRIDELEVENRGYNGEELQDLQAELAAARSDFADAVDAAHAWQSQGLQQHEMFSDLLWGAKMDLDARDRTIQELRQQLRDAQERRRGHRVRRRSRTPLRRRRGGSEQWRR